MVEYLFLDLDDTILDFRKGEQMALRRTLGAFSLDASVELVDRYSRINMACWKAMERGEITREALKTLRFEKLFEEFALALDPHAVSDLFMENLAQGHWFLPGAEEALEGLAKKYRLFLASNGTPSVQKGRMTSANLYRFFEQCFVSEELGAHKPSKAFFDAAFARIPDFDPSRAMMVGDSLSADVQGGINAGIRTCWVNTNGYPPKPGIVPDYEIQSLSQLEALLETIS